jgi:hypothetical protein
LCDKNDKKNNKWLKRTTRDKLTSGYTFGSSAWGLNKESSNNNTKVPCSGLRSSHSIVWSGTSVKFFLLWQKIHNIKYATSTTFKYTIKWPLLQSQNWANITLSVSKTCSLQIETLHSVNNNSLVPFHPTFNQIFLYKFPYSRYFIKHSHSCSTCSFVCWISLSIKFQASIILQPVWQLYSFVWFNNISFYVYTISCLCVHLLDGHELFSLFDFSEEGYKALHMLNVGILLSIFIDIKYFRILYQFF